MAIDQLTTCKTCSKEVAKSASTCPHCGAKLKMSVFGKVLILLGVLFVMRAIYLFLAIPVNIKSTSSSSSSTSFDRNFKGESDHWTGLSQVVGTNYNQVSTDKLIYKGSDLGSVGKVKYSFKSTGSGLLDLSGEDILMKDKEYIMGKGGGNGAVIPANDTIEVTVEWNGKLEKFTLSPTGPIPM